MQTLSMSRKVGAFRLMLSCAGWAAQGECDKNPGKKFVAYS
jgi:hypothetical protein